MKSGAFIIENREELRKRDTEGGKSHDYRSDVCSYADTNQRMPWAPKSGESKEGFFFRAHFRAIY